jgi:hypothetical protein
MKDFSPEDLFQIFIEEGKEGLIAALCVFEKGSVLNNIMEEMVDNSVLAFIGEMPISSFVEKMEFLNDKLYDAVCDEALDKFGNGDISSEILSESLDNLKDRKAKMDSPEKNDK